jgi:hypothetical protein
MRERESRKYKGGKSPTSKVWRGIFILTDSVLYDNQQI